MPKVVHCKKCGAKIYWAVSLVSGSYMPINIDPVSNGNILLAIAADCRWIDGKLFKENTLLAKTLRKGERIKRGHRRFVSHYATCPDAKNRKRKRRNRSQQCVR